MNLTDLLHIEQAATSMIPLAHPYLGRNARRYFNECLDTEWISSRGRFIPDLESAFSEFNGNRRGLAVSNATVGLHLALVAMGIGPGDEVIVPALTFAATINVVLHAGARPVIVDIDPKTWNICPDAIRAAITPRTRAIIPVHLYGYPADMDRILEIAESHDLQVVEDAAEAHGAEYGGRKVGRFGRVGVFSFFGNKIITTGEGGMCVTDDEELYQKMLVLRDHGMNRSTRYLQDAVGYNYRMTNPQAALGVAQMEEVGTILRTRDRIYAAYDQQLQDVPGLSRRDIPPGIRAVNWLYTCLVPRRDEMLQALASAQIEARPVFIPLHKMGIYKGYQGGGCPNAESVAAQGISLPTYVQMSSEAIDRVCRVIRKELGLVG